MANQLFQIAPSRTYLVLYLHRRIYEPSKNQYVVLSPGLVNLFGMTAVNDWPIYDGPDLSRANIVARARGHHIQTHMADHVRQWLVSCSIVFFDGSCCPGSTLVVKGMMTDQKGSKDYWTIVGGTGKFTLAQGVIYCNVVKNNGTEEIRELHIGVSSTPMERSTLGVMFSDFNPSEVDDATEEGTHVGQGGHDDFGTELLGTLSSASSTTGGKQYRKRKMDDAAASGVNQSG